MVEDADNFSDQVGELNQTRDQRLTFDDPRFSPIPFRAALHNCIEQNKFSLEVRGEPYFNLLGRAEDAIRFLETYSPPADEEPIFLLVGALWKPGEAATKKAEDFRGIFRALLPFYEAIVLMGGRFSYFD